MLNERVRTVAEAAGADFVGIADLSGVDDILLDQGGPCVARFPRAVSVGIALMDPLVDLVEGPRDRTAGALYQYHVFSVVNPSLDRCALSVARCLQEAGYRAVPVPASLRTDDARLAGPVSHKLAAHLAGLGWIGKSCLLVTPERGPRVRWITVLTDAPLEPTGGPCESRCGDCRACVEACPAGAFTGRAFVPGEPREARFDAAACDRHYRAIEASGEPAACGICVAVCPWGRCTGEGRGRPSEGVGKRP
ncbi:MAG: 4Fe-4S double cluster binding domain-containing protein [Methanospirillum sp.]